MKKLIQSLVLVSLLMTSIQSQAGVIVAGTGGVFTIGVLANIDRQADDLDTFFAVVGGLITFSGLSLIYAGNKASGILGTVLIVLDEGTSEGFFKFIDENKTLGQLESGVAKEFLADTLSSKFDETKTKQELKLTTDEMNSLLDLEGITSESQLGRSLAGALL